jgi:hypothetical protein
MSVPVAAPNETPVAPVPPTVPVEEPSTAREAPEPLPQGFDPAPTATLGPELLPLVPLHPGESLMTRNWKSLGWTAVLAAAFTTTTPVGAADPTPVLQTDQLVESMKKIQAQLDDIAKTNVQTQEAIKAAAAMRQDLDQLKEQLAQLQRKVDELGRPGATRVSGFAPTAPTARIQLRNEYPTEVKILVNGRTYQLAPNTVQVLDGVPAGKFTYQILNIQPDPQTRDLGANETYLIRVIPT